MSLMAAGHAPGAVMATSSHTMIPQPMFRPANNGSSLTTTAGVVASEGLLHVQELTGAAEVPIGVHVGEEVLRLAAWSAKDKEATTIPADADAPGGALRASACYVRPTHVALGSEVDSLWQHGPQHTLLRPVRLLGRSFSSLPGARWLSDEESHTPCGLAPERDKRGYAAGRARFVLMHERQVKDIRRRANAAAARGAGTKAPATTIETYLAPEEVVAKLLRRAASSGAEAMGGALPTSAVLAVPAGSSLAFRQAVADAATMAGLEVLRLRSSIVV